jgi:Protein of unknown function (DUF3106)
MGIFNAQESGSRIRQLISVAALVTCAFSHAQLPTTPVASALVVNPSPTSKKPAPAQSSSPASAMKWGDLTQAQQSALRPLQPQWVQMSSEHKRKWLEISKNHQLMSPAQQEAMQARMTEWAQMSPDKRAQARMNFAEAKEASKSLTAEEKRARWEAYQALSPEEKRKLVRSIPAAKSASPAITPVSPQRLTELPKHNASAASVTPARSPRIAASPDQIHSTTLLPQSSENSKKQ